MKKFMHRIAAWLLVLVMCGSFMGQLGTTKVQAATYPGDYGEGYSVALSELATFDGDVTFTIEFELQDGYEYSQLAFVSKIEGWPKIHESDFVNASYPTYDGYWFNTLRSLGTNTIELTLSKEAVQRVINEKGGLGIQVYGVAISKVTLSGEASEGNPNAGYVGDWGAGAIIPASDFEGFTGDVTFTLKYREVSLGYSYFQVKYTEAISAGWVDLTGSDFKDYEHVLNSYGCFELVPGEKEITVVLTKEAVKRMVANQSGIGVVVYGVIVEDYELSGAKPTAVPTPTNTPKPTPTNTPKPTPTLKPGQPTPTPTNTPTPTPTNTPTPTPTPIVYKEVEKLVLTADMVGKDGTLAVTNYKAKAVYIPRDTGAKKITLDYTIADKLVVEGGAEYTLELVRGTFGEVLVVPAQVNGIEGEITTAKNHPVLEEYALASQTMTKALTITTGKNATVTSLVVTTNAELKLNQGKVKDVTLDATNAYLMLDVDVKGYRGDLNVKQPEEGSGCTVRLDLGASKVEDLTISGNGRCTLKGNTATVENLVLDGDSRLTSMVDAKNFTIGEKATDTRVKLYSDVDHLQVEGNGNDIVLANSAKVEKAEVAGDSTRIYGYGKLENAEITGKEANVATPNTRVEGENDKTRPQEMENMKPNTGGDSNGTVVVPSGPQEMKITLNLDSSYPGDYSCGTNITKDVLQQFSGDVAITLDYVLTGTAEWPQFGCVLAWSDGWPKLMVSSAGENGFTNLAKDKTSITFVISKEDIQRVATQNEGGGELGLQVSGAYFTKAVLRDAKKADFYVGDYQQGYSFKNAEVKELYGDVTLTVRYTLLEGFTNHCFQLTEIGSSWIDLKAEDFVDFTYEMKEDGVSIPALADTDTMTFKIKADSFKEIADNGSAFAVRVYGIIVEEATLVGEEKPAEPENPEVPEIPSTVVYIGAGYPGDYQAGSWIPANVFTQLTGDATITVEYVVVDDAANPQFACINESWGKVPTSLATEFMQADKTTNTLTFTIAKENFPGTKVGFQVNGMYITKATISGEGTLNEDSAYAGDWQIGYNVSPAELTPFAGKDIDVTITYKKLNDASYTWYKGNLAELGGYTDMVESNLAGNETTKTLQLPAAKVDELLAGSTALGIKVYGVIIENVEIAESAAE